MEVRTLGRRFVVVTAAATLLLANVAVCAGWQTTPEARMACCTNGDTCPMHKSPSHDSGEKRVVSQAQADSCCATSEGHDSSTAGSRFVLSGSFALAPSPVPPVQFVVPTLALHVDNRRALVPLPRSPVPTHLLLTVFLV
jgi:hypothetical protein